jgi:hypothetical protein
VNRSEDSITTDWTPSQRAALQHPNLANSCILRISNRRNIVKLFTNCRKRVADFMDHSSHLNSVVAPFAVVIGADRLNEGTMAKRWPGVKAPH